MVEVINVSFVGHLGDSTVVAAVGLGNMFLNVVCLSVVFGLNSTLQTLMPQSFG
jgi:Na+-driven multidrug efflux pump